MYSAICRVNRWIPWPSGIHLILLFFLNKRVTKEKIGETDAHLSDIPERSISLWNVR